MQIKYHFISKNRYSFGKTFCGVPSENLTEVEENVDCSHCLNKLEKANANIYQFDSL
jgi:hypothetical protein